MTWSSISFVGRSADTDVRSVNEEWSSDRLCLVAELWMLQLLASIGPAPGGIGEGGGVP